MGGTISAQELQSAMTAQEQNLVGGTTTVPNGWSSQPYNAPHVCPGCGRCKDCGRPYETQPFTPWPGYPRPYIGDPVYPWLGPNWNEISGGMNVNTPTVTGLQSWN